MKIISKNYSSPLIILFLILQIFFEVGCCIEEFIFHEKASEKQIKWYVEQPRDERFQGWWGGDNKFGSKYEAHYLFFDILTGKEVLYYSENNNYFSIDYWYSKEDTLCKCTPNKSWPNGVCKFDSYYRFKEDSILQISFFPVGACKKDDPDTKWSNYFRVTNSSLLDSLKQYEPLHNTIPTKNIYKKMEDKE